jgi:hypothetical protein
MSVFELSRSRVSIESTLRHIETPRIYPCHDSD